MVRALDEMLAELTLERRARIDARYRELREEVDSLRELRKATGKAQAEIARALRIKQPSVSKLERQVDMYLSTLRRYVQAVGGELELVVKLPSRPPLRLNQFSDAFDDPPDAVEAAPRRSRRKTAAAKAPRKRTAVAARAG